MSYFRNIFITLHFLAIFGTLCANGGSIVEECEESGDGHLTRGHHTCCSTSPRGIPLQSTIDFLGSWDKCAVEPLNQKEDPVISAWRVYRCIVFSGMKGKPLRPSTFTMMASQRYPVSIKRQILSQMGQLETQGDMTFEVDVECRRRTPYPKVHVIRNLFYDIEQEVCEGEGQRSQSQRSRSLVNDTLTFHYGGVQKVRIPPKTVNSSIGSVLEFLKGLSNSDSRKSTDLADVLCVTCDRAQELYHRNGDCCSHVPIPFPFIYLPYRYGNDPKVEQCTADLVDDVGLPDDTQFATQLKYLCIPSCEHFLSGTISEDDLWAGMKLFESKSDLRALIMKITPKYFSPRYKLQIINYILQNWQDAWQETKTFESRLKPSQRDLRKCDKGKLKNLLASCKAHRLVESVTTLYLNNLCLDEYPWRDADDAAKPKPKPTTPGTGTNDHHDTDADDYGTGDDFDWSERRNGNGNRNNNNNNGRGQSRNNKGR